MKIKLEKKKGKTRSEYVFIRVTPELKAKVESKLKREGASMQALGEALLKAWLGE